MKWGERVLQEVVVVVVVGGAGLTLQFSCVSGSEEKEEDV